MMTATAVKCHFTCCNDEATHIAFFPRVKFEKPLRGKLVWNAASHPYCKKDAEWLVEHAGAIICKAPKELLK